jgi:hypothetical protein
MSAEQVDLRPDVATMPSAEACPDALPLAPLVARSTVEKVFNEGCDGTLLALTERGTGECLGERASGCVGTRWHFVASEFHQSAIRNVEMCAEGTEYPRRRCFDLPSLELLEVGRRDTCCDGDRLERLASLGPGVGELSAKLSSISRHIFHGGDRTQ